MQLFQLPDDPYCHRVRLVIAEKGLDVELIDCDTDDAAARLRSVNPYGSVPTLLDHGLRLHDSRVIIDYLDERYPSPPLMPIDPPARAQIRLALAEVERDWYDIAAFIQRSQDPVRVQQAQHELLALVSAASSVLNHCPFFLSREFTLLDATVLPILCRLDQLGLTLKREDAPLAKYLQRMVDRHGFAWAAAGRPGTGPAPSGKPLGAKSRLYLVGDEA